MGSCTQDYRVEYVSVSGGASTDYLGKSFTVAPVTLQNLDNDTASVTACVVGEGCTDNDDIVVAENAGSKQVQVRLGSKPRTQVKFSVGGW